MKKTKYSKTKIIIVTLIVVLSLASIHYINTIPQQTGAYQTVTLVYSDGTEETYSSLDMKETPFQIMRIVDYTTRLNVVNLIFRIYITPTYTGQITSYRVTGTTRAELRSGTGSTFYKTLWGPTYFETSGPTTGFVSGQQVLVSQSTISSATLQSWYTGWANGASYSYRILEDSNQLRVYLHYSDGTELTLATQVGYISYRFIYYST